MTLIEHPLAAPPAGGEPRATILVAEDEALIAEELRDRLESLGYEVAGVVATAEEAVERAGETDPDLVLMDVRLGGQFDGIEAAARLGDRFGIPVVYVTAHSDGATVERAKRTGPLGYLVKPVEEQELRITVEMALHKADLERRLKESEEWFATTLTSIGDAVIATDTESRITFMNPVAEALTRWPQQDAVGRPLMDVFRIVGSVTRAARDNPVARALRDGRVVTLPDQTVLLARDGTEVAIADSAAPIRHPRRGVCGAVVVFRDVTRQKRAEDAVRLAEDRVRQAQKIEAVGRLAGGIAHDVNNMMTVVTGFGELVLEQLPEGHPVRGMVREIKKAGDRAAAVTRQLLAFSRKQVLSPVVLDLNQVVEDMQTMLRRLIGEDVALSSHLTPNLRPVKADPAQLGQVILNLVVNARDSMPRGGELRLDTRNARLSPARAEALGLDPGDYAQLTVGDTGVGMDADTRARLFEPFFTTKPGDPGAGLGLATVHGIVKQSGGHVEVESDVGKGTRFHIFLPHVRGEVPVRVAKPEPAAPRGTESILLVEDDDGVRGVTRLLLQSWGYAVHEAATASEALALCEQTTRFDLLLTDAVMPNMSGRLLARRVAELRPGVRIVFMSGYSENSVLGDDLRSASHDFVQKPFTPAELATTIRNALDGPPAGAENP
jgi:two-component system cell cycle sensor histidine kinase/response regulator CckA